MSPGFGRFRVFVREWQDRYALCHSRTETRITQSTRGDNYPDTGGIRAGLVRKIFMIILKLLLGLGL